MVSSVLLGSCDGHVKPIFTVPQSGIALLNQHILGIPQGTQLGHLSHQSRPSNMGNSLLFISMTRSISLKINSHIQML